MPLYDVKCDACGQTFEMQIAIDQFDQFKAGEVTVSCQSNAEEASKECSSESKTILISGLKTRHKSWWNWKDVTK